MLEIQSYMVYICHCSCAVSAMPMHAATLSDSDMNHSTVEPVATSGHLYKATTSLLWPLPMVLDDPFTFSILPA